jgi:hypothetical protein
MKEANKPPAGRNIPKRLCKRVISHTFWLRNRRKRRFLTQKYLIRYTPKMFFEEYIIFKKIVTKGVVELYLFKILGVIYAPSYTD